MKLKSELQDYLVIVVKFNATFFIQRYYRFKTLNEYEKVGSFFLNLN